MVVYSTGIRILCRNRERERMTESGSGKRGKGKTDRHSWNAQAKSSTTPTVELNLLFDVCTTAGVIVDLVNFP